MSHSHNHTTVLQSHNLTVSQSYNLTVSQSHNLTLSHSHNLTISQSHNLTLSQSHNLTIPHSHTLTLSHSHTLTLSYSHSHVLTLTVSGQEVETDGPRSGHISNIEPLYSSVREGRSRPSTLFFSIELILYSLSHQQLQIFLSLLGSNLPENQTEISVEDLKKEILSWKSVNVKQKSTNLFP